MFFFVLRVHLHVLGIDRKQLCKRLLLCFVVYSCVFGCHSVDEMKLITLFTLLPSSLSCCLLLRKKLTGYQTVWEIRPSAGTPSSVYWRRFYFQLTCVHSALELLGRCALQIYLLTYLLDDNGVPTLMVCRQKFWEAVKRELFLEVFLAFKLKLSIF